VERAADLFEMFVVAGFDAWLANCPSSPVSRVKHPMIAKNAHMIQHHGATPKPRPEQPNASRT
jgi:hypothetical protein